MVSAVKGGTSENLISKAYACFTLVARRGVLAVASCNSSELEVTYFKEDGDELQLEEEGKFMLPADAFFRELSSYNGDKVKIQVSEDTFHMICGRDDWKQSRFSDEDEMMLAFKKTQEYPLGEEPSQVVCDLATILKKIELARDLGAIETERQYDLDGIKIEFDPQGKITASAATRQYFGFLSTRISPDDIKNMEEPRQLFLTNDVVDELIRIKPRVLRLGSNALVAKGDADLFAMTGDFEFPETPFLHTFESDRTFEFKSRVDRKEMSRILKRCRSQVHEVNTLRSISLSFVGDAIKIIGEGDGRKIKSEVAAETLSGNPPMNPYVTDPDWMSNFVESCSGPSFDIYFISDDHPIYLVGTDETILGVENEKFFFVVTSKG